MVQKSLANVRRNGSPILDRHEVIALLTLGEGGGRRVIGAVALNLDRLQAPDHGLVVFNCQNVVMATGGPGEMYEASAYPRGQIGNHGIALEIGAIANNLGESQFGLASTSFRWNLSGTYQQVIPCYYSTDPGGGDLRYFLNDYFHDMGQLATAVFLKGYQWPFHAARLQGLGSSVIDLAVFNETCAGRIVWMDFRRNPVATGGMKGFAFELLGDEARRYLEGFHGIGRKTAACVLVFSMGRDVFPVDTHIHRVCNRLGLASSKTAEQTYEQMRLIVPPRRAYSFHVNLIRFGRKVCRSQHPLCGECPLYDRCAFQDKERHALNASGSAAKSRGNPDFIILHHVS